MDGSRRRRLLTSFSEDEWETFGERRRAALQQESPECVKEGGQPWPEPGPPEAEEAREGP